MREKYVEERYPRYFVFGEHKDGRIDVASGQQDTVATVSKEHAENLITDRDALIGALCAMAAAFDDAAPLSFQAFWYGGAV